LIDSFTSEEGRDEDDEPRDEKKFAVKSTKVSTKGSAKGGADFRDGCTAQKAFDWADVSIEIQAGDKQDSATAVAVKIDSHWRVLYIH
jgi:hypothetical protein